MHVCVVAPSAAKSAKFTSKHQLSKKVEPKSEDTCFSLAVLGPCDPVPTGSRPKSSPIVFYTASSTKVFKEIKRDNASETNLHGMTHKRLNTIS